MNTSRSKPIVRFSGGIPKPKGRPPSALNGHYASGLWNDELAALVGRIATMLPQIEETMIDFLGLLLGGNHMPSRQIFRAIIGEEIRIKVLRSLLEHASINKDKGQEFDEVIDLFASVKNKRNTLVHGLWYTHESGRAFIAEPTTEHSFAFFDTREVRKAELLEDLKRMGDLNIRAMALTHPGIFEAARASSPKKSKSPRVQKKRAAPQPSRSGASKPPRQPKASDH